MSLFCQNDSTHITHGSDFPTASGSAKSAFNFCFVLILIENPLPPPNLSNPPVWVLKFGCTAKLASVQHPKTLTLLLPLKFLTSFGVLCGHFICLTSCYQSFFCWFLHYCMWHCHDWLNVLPALFAHEKVLCHNSMKKFLLFRTNTLVSDLVKHTMCFCHHNPFCFVIFELNWELFQNFLCLFVMSTVKFLSSSKNIIPEHLCLLHLVAVTSACSLYFSFDHSKNCPFTLLFAHPDTILSAWNWVAYCLPSTALFATHGL